jgi:hypothetical protein
MDELESRVGDIRLNVNRLYKVMAGCVRSKGPMDCAWGQVQVPDCPLSQLDSKWCADYSRHAVATVGTIEDFKYFLPRLVELATDKLAGGLVSLASNQAHNHLNGHASIDWFSFAGSIRYAGFATWRSVERQAVVDVLRAAFTAACVCQGWAVTRAFGASPSAQDFFYPLIELDDSPGWVVQRWAQDLRVRSRAGKSEPNQFLGLLLVELAYEWRNPVATWKAPRFWDRFTHAHLRLLGNRSTCSFLKLLINDRAEPTEWLAEHIESALVFAHECRKRAYARAE